MLHPTPEPHERFRERRRQERRRRAVRRLGIFALLALTAAGLTLGVRSFGGDEPRVVTNEAEHPTPAPAAPSVDLTLADAAPSDPPAEIRGVHIPAPTLATEELLQSYIDLKRFGLNTLEVDVKDENGEIAFPIPDATLARAIGAERSYYDPRALSATVYGEDLYLIGRVVVFEDPILAAGASEMAIRTTDGDIWTNAAGLGWTDPYNEGVWRYNVDVAIAAAESGFDEIMFDKVRFPLDGQGAVYPRKVKEPRHVTIKRFLAYANSRLEPLGVRVSVSLFGLAASTNLGVGQQPRRLANQVDALYPRIFPSHFQAGEFGIPNPPAAPGTTVSSSLRAFADALEDRPAELIPWLQDFSFDRVYDLPEVRAQVDATRRADTGGFMLWNESGEYTAQGLAAP